MHRPLFQVFARWLASLKPTHAPPTLDTWRCYVKAHWLPFFGDHDGLTREQFHQYIRTRLGQVQKPTVKKERSALLNFLEWGLNVGDIEAPEYAPEPPEDPSMREQWAKSVANSWVPQLPDRGLGTPFKQRRRVASFDLEPAQVQALIEALPEWSTSRRVGRFPVRPRFIVAYETALRPSTLDRLQVPKHYRIGADRLELSADTDKARYARPVPLSKRAREVLDELLRGYGESYIGPIFGKHDYRQHLKRAAEKALPPQLAEKFAGTHLRAHRITHLLEKGANLLGTQWLAGHKQIATTSKYAKPSFRAALDSLGAM
jgi:integrase